MFKYNIFRKIKFLFFKIKVEDIYFGNSYYFLWKDPNQAGGPYSYLMQITNITGKYAYYNSWYQVKKNGKISWHPSKINKQTLKKSIIKTIQNFKLYSLKF